MEELQEVVIVGAGIAGLATAVALKRVGVRSMVLERADELRTTGAAISFFPNAWRALEVLGVAHKLAPIYRLIKSGHVNNLESGVVQEVYYTGRTTGVCSDNTGVPCVHRKQLLMTMAEELSPGTIRFSSKLASIKITNSPEDSSTVTVLHLEDGSVIRTKVLIGCDGVHSVVAQWLGLSAPIDSGRSCVRGLASFPEGHGFKYEVHTFLRSSTRTGFVPLSDTEVYWYATQNTTSREKEIGRDPKLILREVIENIAKDFPPDFRQVVHHADLSTVSWAPLMLRVPWDLILRRMQRGNVAVAGDAMHPMTPDIGQGGASALEDAVVLVRNIGIAVNAEGVICGKKVEEGIEKYVKERRWRVAGFIVAAYLSGLVQQGGSGFSGWALKWFRDHVFYRFVMPRVLDAVFYDCGELTSVV